MLAQLLLTCAVLGLVPGNGLKLALFVAIWILTFRRLTLREALAGIVVCAFFSLMNVHMLRNGAFAFLHPDYFGMPIYEFVMWGFYILHVTRTLGGHADAKGIPLAVVLAIAFSVPFATLTDPAALLAGSSAVLLVSLALFHQRLDLCYAGYMILVGALIEYTGVWSGQWSYPGSPPGGVPLWFAPMWGGIGVFVRRLVTPLLRSDGSAPS